MLRKFIAFAVPTAIGGAATYGLKRYVAPMVDAAVGPTMVESKVYKGVRTVAIYAPLGVGIYQGYQAYQEVGEAGGLLGDQSKKA